MPQRIAPITTKSGSTRARAVSRRVRSRACSTWRRVRRGTRGFTASRRRCTQPAFPPGSSRSASVHGSGGRSASAGDQPAVHSGGELERGAGGRDEGAHAGRRRTYRRPVGPPRGPLAHRAAPVRGSRRPRSRRAPTGRPATTARRPPRRSAPRRRWPASAARRGRAAGPRPDPAVPSSGRTTTTGGSSGPGPARPGQPAEPLDRPRPVPARGPAGGPTGRGGVRRRSRHARACAGRPRR